MTERRVAPFLFEGEIPVRIIDRDGMFWFVAADVCRALGLTNASETVKSLDDDEKGISSADTLMGNQEVIVISESGLYALIFKSRKPDAIRFRKWVTSEVLPTIRRTGAFVSANAMHGEKSLEETRISLLKVNTSFKTFNKATAAWVWEHEGLPMPPPKWLPGGDHPDLFK